MTQCRGSGSLYEQVLGSESFNALSATVRRFHSPSVGDNFVAHGTATINWGNNVLSRVLATILLLPRPKAGVKVRAEVSWDGTCQVTQLFSFYVSLC